jgi:hypothetical protein
MREIQDESERCRHQALLRPLEQRHAQPRFEAANQARDGGLRDIERGGRLGDPAGAGHLDQGAELTKPEVLVHEPLSENGQSPV